MSTPSSTRAAIVSNAAPLDAAWEVNVRGTQRVLRAAVAAGVPRFMHIHRSPPTASTFLMASPRTHPVQISGYSYVDLGEL